MAVAITLLVLNIAVPGTGQALGHELGHNWPAYVAYVISFLTIGIIWINHHISIGRLARTDHSILMLNLMLLLTVVVIPFGTSLLADYLTAGQGDHLAAGVYAGILLAMAVAFSVLNGHILFRRPHMLRFQLSLEERRLIFLRSASGVIPYALATALAVVSPYATLGVTAALAAFYALPFAGGLIG